MTIPTVQACCSASFSSSCNVFCAASQSGLCGYTLSDLSTATKKFSFSSSFRGTSYMDTNSPTATIPHTGNTDEAEMLSLHSASTKIIGRVWPDDVDVWSFPVRSVAIVGESSLLILVFSNREDAAKDSQKAASCRDKRGGNSKLTENCMKGHQCANYRMRRCNSTTTGTIEPDMHRISRSCFVYIYDAWNKTFFAELYFGGAAVQSVHANAHFLVATTADALHVVELRTLRYVSQFIMNRKSLHGSPVLDLARDPLPLPVAAYTTTPTTPTCAASSNTHQTIHHISDACEQTKMAAYRLAYAPCQRDVGDVELLTCIMSSSSCPPPSSSSFASRTCTRMSSSSSKVSHNQDGTETSYAHNHSVVSSRYVPRETQSIVSQSIVAHSCPIAVLALNRDGSLLASVSTRGSTVKLFCAQSGRLLNKYYRGYRRAMIYSLALSDNSTLLAALSSSGTLHLFNTHDALYAVKQCNTHSHDSMSRSRVSASASARIRHAVWEGDMPSIRSTAASVGVMCADKPRAVMKKRLFCQPGMIQITTMGMNRPCLSRIAEGIVHKTAVAISRLKQRYTTAPLCVDTITKSNDEGSQSLLPSPALGWTYAMQFSCDGGRVWVTQLGPRIDTRSLGSSPANGSALKQGTLQCFSVTHSSSDPEEVHIISFGA